MGQTEANYKNRELHFYVRGVSQRNERRNDKEVTPGSRQSEPCYEVDEWQRKGGNFLDKHHPKLPNWG